ncbi:Nuclear transcription factor Y subunit beta [Operophtera brumata]|uniref:Nuclear transcription factor Y subunit beta n=1 Tax=Operophtera brumata TaxID=104452 RepID=A0A0L7KUE0_OPEBR|nr:Nuclear transcription factor Y subunit beta [Operophtera brumata]
MNLNQVIVVCALCCTGATSGSKHQARPEVEHDEFSKQVASLNAPLREQDRFLPIANIAKIMKRAIPDNGKIAKDARECLQECISEFISFVTSEASDRCQVEKRKTINGEDVLFAMNALGFDNYVTINKLSKTIIIYGGEDGAESACINDNGNDGQSDSAVLYAYPKGGIDEYNIS